MRLFKNIFFYRTSTVAACGSLSFQPTALLKKRLGEKCSSVNFAKFLRASFFRTPLDGDFLCLSVSFEKFLDQLFYRSCASSQYTIQQFIIQRCTIHVQIMQTCLLYIEINCDIKEVKI